MWYGCFFNVVRHLDVCFMWFGSKNTFWFNFKWPWSLEVFYVAWMVFYVVGVFFMWYECLFYVVKCVLLLYHIKNEIPDEKRGSHFKLPNGGRNPILGTLFLRLPWWDTMRFTLLCDFLKHVLIGPRMARRFKRFGLHRSYEGRDVWADGVAFVIYFS